MRAIYFADPMGDHPSEILLISDALRDHGIKIDIIDYERPPKKDDDYDIMFFDWGGMSIGNSILEHFCEHWIEEARNKPNRLYVMTSHFTQVAMEDLREYSQREIEEFPKNIFMCVEDAIPYIKVLLNN